LAILSPDLKKRGDQVEPAEVQANPPLTTGPIRGWVGPFISLRNPDFRWFLVAISGFFNGMQMGVVAQGWLVYTLTDSALSLGLISAAWGVPLVLFSLFGGMVADRMPKRNLIIVTQGAVCFLSLIMAVLVTTGLVRYWHLILGSVLSGTIMAFSLPARQAFISEVVGQWELLNAIALNSAVMNVCRIFSPALAGILLKLIGIPGVYWIIFTSYSLGAIFLTRIRSKAVPPERPIISKRKQLLSGLHYVRGQAILLILMVIAFVALIVGSPYQMLMPVFARDVFKAGGTGLGLLFSADGSGALIGSSLVSALGNFKHKGKLMLTGGMVFSIFLILFSQSGSLKAACLFLLLASVGGSILSMLTITLVMSNTPKDLVGRVMSLYMITWGLMPLGMLPAGALAEVFGAPIVVSTGGAILLIFLVIMAISQPRLKRL
jgi:MFS family permease